MFVADKFLECSWSSMPLAAPAHTAWVVMSTAAAECVLVAAARVTVARIRAASSITMNNGHQLRAGRVALVCGMSFPCCCGARQRG